MKKSIILPVVFSCLGLLSFGTQANDKVETIYNAQKFQQVCRGKTQGDTVSFAHKGIIWNGTCEAQFFPTVKNTKFTIDVRELANVCRADSTTKTIEIDGKEIKGKCTLGFTPPTPRS
jgi:hypothetical protein